MFQRIYLIVLNTNLSLATTKKCFFNLFQYLVTKMFQFTKLYVILHFLIKFGI